VVRSYLFNNKADDLKQNLVIHNHNMRSKYDLHTHFCNTALFHRSVLNTGIDLYKSLPLNIKKSDNFNCFKKEVKAALLNNFLYDLGVFTVQVIVVG
jgi:hypothetical protein